MVESLTKAKNAALEDARSAQAKVDVLNDKLKVQTQQMMDLQDQIKTIRSVLEQLQQEARIGGASATGERREGVYPFVTSRGSRPSSMAMILFTRRW